jgi:hypothetical protein
MSKRTIAVDPVRLEAGIEALARAGQAFELSRFERISYRMLMVSVDVAIASFVAIVLLAAPIAFVDIETMIVPIMVPASIFILAAVVGLFALVLNIPLFLRARRESARLKQLGLDALSQSLWQESRRSRWIRRIRSAFVFVIGAFSLLVALVSLVATSAVELEAFFVVVFYLMLAILLFAARHLRNQRERIDLAARAADLRAQLLRMRQDAGEGGSIEVPSDLLAQAARVETVRIAQERKDAVLQSVASRPGGYAVSFEPGAAARKTALDIAARIELEDMVEQISTGGADFDARAGIVFWRDGAAFRARSSGGRIEIECVLDEAARSVRVTAVTQAAAGAAPLPREAGDG